MGSTSVNSIEDEPAAGESMLEPGRVFLYSGPRQWPFGRRGLAIGKVIGAEVAQRIVHVRTYITTQEGGDEPVVYVGHLPILVAALIPSIVEFRGLGRVDEDAWKTVTGWRRRYAAGEVGAFVDSLWKVEKMARETLPEAVCRQSIEYAFPKSPGPGAALSMVEVALF
jgi:hypothetical protein